MSIKIPLVAAIPYNFKEENHVILAIQTTSCYKPSGCLY